MATGSTPALLPRRTLVIAARRQIARDIHAFELADPAGADLPEFQPGSHVVVLVPSGADRKYSLCSAPDERHRYLIAVKREAAGRGGSASLVDQARAGDPVDVSDPVNAFALAPGAASHILIAGGIGITPILAMARHLKASGGRFRLYYLTRSAEETAFLPELSAPAFKGLVTLHHDGGDPDRGFDLWPVLEQPRGAHVYCCGPRGLMQAVRDMTGHWSKAAVHFESFIDGEAASRPEDRPFKVRLARSGRIVQVPAGTTILSALRAAGLDVASSCESGSCGTCRTPLLAGAVDHRDLVLTEAEHATQIMICVSRATGDEIEIDL